MVILCDSWYFWNFLVNEENLFIWKYQSDIPYFIFFNSGKISICSIILKWTNTKYQHSKFFSFLSKLDRYDLQIVLMIENKIIIQEIYFFWMALGMSFNLEKRLFTNWSELNFKRVLSLDTTYNINLLTVHTQNTTMCKNTTASFLLTHLQFMLFVDHNFVKIFVLFKLVVLR